MGIGFDIGADTITMSDGEGRAPTPVSDARWRDVVALAIAHMGDTEPIDLQNTQETAQQRLPHEIFAAEVAGLMVYAGDASIAQLGRGVAVAVPSWWSSRANTVARKAVRDLAGRQVGLVRDAVAAARRARSVGLPIGDVTVVLDLGARTCSATVVTRCDTAAPAIMGTPGVLVDDAGAALDTRVMEHLRNAVDDVDDRELLTASRRAREALSRHEAVTVVIPGTDARPVLTQADLARIVDPWLQRVIAMLSEAVDSSRETPTSVLAVGGLSGSAMVAQAVSEALGLTVLMEAEPALTVARGARLSAAELEVLPAPRPAVDTSVEPVDVTVAQPVVHPEPRQPEIEALEPVRRKRRLFGRRRKDHADESVSDQSVADRLARLIVEIDAARSPATVPEAEQAPEPEQTPEPDQTPEPEQAPKPDRAEQERARQEEEAAERRAAEHKAAERKAAKAAAQQEREERQKATIAAAIQKAAEREAAEREAAERWQAQADADARATELREQKARAKEERRAEKKRSKRERREAKLEAARLEAEERLQAKESARAEAEERRQAERAEKHAAKAEAKAVKQARRAAKKTAKGEKADSRAALKSERHEVKLARQAETAEAKHEKRATRKAAKAEAAERKQAQREAAAIEASERREAKRLRKAELADQKRADQEAAAAAKAEGESDEAQSGRKARHRAKPTAAEQAASDGDDTTDGGHPAKQAVRAAWARPDILVETVEEEASADQPAETVDRKQAKRAEKQAARESAAAAKQHERAATDAAKEARRAEKVAAKESKRAAKVAAKESKRAAKIAAKEAERDEAEQKIAEKDAARAEAAAAKEAKRAAKIEAKEAKRAAKAQPEPDDLAEDEPEEPAEPTTSKTRRRR